MDLTCVSKVTASIVCDSHLWKGKVTKKSMNEDAKVIELHQQAVQFQPKFLVGTRKNAVNLRFSVAVKSEDTVHTIESDLSNPFIVITNECQWAEAEGTLIKKGNAHHFFSLPLERRVISLFSSLLRSEAFGGHLEIPWARFANVFQMHFIRATRQDVNKPARAFHAGDFEYLHDKFFGNKQMVSYKDFDQVCLSLPRPCSLLFTVPLSVLGVVRKGSAYTTLSAACGQSLEERARLRLHHQGHRSPRSRQRATRLLPRPLLREPRRLLCRRLQAH